VASNWKDTISYASYGEGKPLVVLHALGTDHRAMQAWMEPLFANRPGWQRIYIDLPAHGHSHVKEWVTTSEDILHVILGFLDDFIPEKRFTLAGKSYGGYIAQGIYAKRKELLDGFFLLAPALHLQKRTLPDKTILRQDEEMLHDLHPDIRTAFETLMVVQTRENLTRFLEEVQPGRLLADRDFLTSEWRTKGYFFSLDPIDSTSLFTAPTLFLLGRQDAICGYSDHWSMLEHFPHATFSILDSVGHMLEIEKRQLVQTLCGDWLDRVEHFVQKNSLG
jgi:pimeloyl-ACP methyl ester carboxylesterase